MKFLVFGFWSLVFDSPASLVVFSLICGLAMCHSVELSKPQIQESVSKTKIRRPKTKSQKPKQLPYFNING